jgi:malate dehydrogenase
MGAQQDSLRFARAVANDLGISRYHVRASVLGEHGPSMVPLWGSVELLTARPDHQDRLAALRAKAFETPLAIRASELMRKVSQLLELGLHAEAYQACCRALPDARIMVEPLITVRGMHSTPNATANATLQLIDAVISVDRRRLHGQVMLEGEALGIHGVCGFPIMIDRKGWHLWDLSCLDRRARQAVISSADAVRAFFSELGVGWDGRPAGFRQWESHRGLMMSEL